MCKRGDFVDCIVSGRKVQVDRCIAPIINALNDAGIITAESCCGHGEEEGHIVAYQGGQARLLVVYALGEPSIEMFQNKYRRMAELSEEKTKSMEE